MGMPPIPSFQRSSCERIWRTAVSWMVRVKALQEDTLERTTRGWISAGRNVLSRSARGGGPFAEGKGARERRAFRAGKGEQDQRQLANDQHGRLRSRVRCQGTRVGFSGKMCGDC